MLSIIGYEDRCDTSSKLTRLQEILIDIHILKTPKRSHAVAYVTTDVVKNNCHKCRILNQRIDNLIYFVNMLINAFI
jgi:hypothetical protein